LLGHPENLNELLSPTGLAAQILKAKDDRRKIRVLRDQARMEERNDGPGMWNNLHAGADVVIHIRYKPGLQLPIPIYTGELGLLMTRYVTKLPNTGSTKLRAVPIYKYITGLASSGGDKDWIGYNAGGIKRTEAQDIDPEHI